MPKIVDEGFLLVLLATISKPAQKRMLAVLSEYSILHRDLYPIEANEASMMLVRISDEDWKARGGAKMDIPKDKTHPADAGQCHDCGGHGCQTCDGKGWLPKGHSMTRKCEREGCGNVLAPSWVPVYCSGQCALMDI